DRGAVEDFLALSSTCPHLGCRVHWEVQNRRFFCPCHNGSFDAAGRATGGPPAEAGQSLPRYALRLEGGLLFIELPVETPSGGSRGRGGS
ncbi:MAG: Rieske 2Fe-2S domain-containing protein, partial [Planctomycetes bacterium]|nr:Rieske 2Fe-2S domain-containing protein [Planctomycetota bacterium]